MQQVAVGDIEICADELGDRSGAPLLLIHGLAGQLISWDDELCALFGAAGYRVLRYDNRDAGKSTIVDAPRFRPDARRSVNRDAATYTLDDLADDAAGLLKALDIDAAHVLGASMGAMIGQTLAVRHPAKVMSLSSIMGSTGAPDVGLPSEAAAAVLVRAPAKDRQGFIDGELANMGIFGSRGALVDDAWRRRRYGRLFDRGLQPRGTGRNLMAIFASGDRTEALASIVAPTLVIHGDADTLIDMSGGEATARAIPGAELMIIHDMGHELPPALWPGVVEAVTANASRAVPGSGAQIAKGTR